MKNPWQRGAEAGQAVIMYAGGVQGEVIRSKELKLRKGKCERHSVKAFLTVMSISPWHPLLREAVEDPLLETFKEGDPGNTRWGWAAGDCMAPSQGWGPCQSRQEANCLDLPSPLWGCWKGHLHKFLE